DRRSNRPCRRDVFGGCRGHPSERGDALPHRARESGMLAQGRVDPRQDSGPCRRSEGQTEAGQALIRALLFVGTAIAAVPLLDLRDRPGGTDITACLPDRFDRTMCGEGTRRKSLDPREMSLVVRTLLGEASGQGDAEVRAIAQVVFNRLESRRWGSTVASV